MKHRISHRHSMSDSAAVRQQNRMTRLTSLAVAVSLALGTASFAYAANAQNTQPPAPASGSTAQASKAASSTAQASTPPSGKLKPLPADEVTAPTLSTIVVTGTTSKKRTLLNASLAITAISSTDLQQKAPLGTDDILEMVPGIFVEGTAGPVSNNYSVRGLPGGGQKFIRLIEDGMPAIYGGLNDDEVFQNSLAIQSVQAVVGGSSGILTPNAAGASINFITRALNFDKRGGLVRIAGTSFGERREDFWYSAPIAAGLAYAISGYYDSNPGTRSSAFRYDTWHTMFQLQKNFYSGATVKLMVKNWNEHDPYYADQPYAYNNGKISSIPGLGTQFGNIIGPSFANITVPDSCAAGECFRTFSMANGIHATGGLYRIDFDVPINDHLSAFARLRYTTTDWNFNGVFAGSGTGNGGLASAVTYLTPGAASPIESLLTAGLASFPAATQFGIMNVATGQVIAGSNTAALSTLNGNGLLEQTVLNRQDILLNDWGSDFGIKWDASGDGWTNDAAVGGMLYSTKVNNDQSGTATVINDVKNQSNIYNVVALNSAGTVLGALTNNGLIGYGTWGEGISSYNQTSESAYVNNEFVWNERLHIDVGVRYEHEKLNAASGNSSSLPIPPGVVGVVQTNPNTFNGTYSHASGSEHPLNYTFGANYVLANNLSVYARFARAYQTEGLNRKATALILKEVGVTFADYGFLGTVRLFRTEFNDQAWGGGVDPANPNLRVGFFGNSDTNGVNVDVHYRPYFGPLQAFAVRAQATYQDPAFNNVSTGNITVNGLNISSEANAFYNGKTPGRTPKVLYTITPQYDLPNRRGQIYLRYKYIGRIFADNGDQVSLPGYGVVSIGAIYNLSKNARLNVSVDNITDVLGLTEGNPRQGFTQQIVNGYFYGRGIVGTTVFASVTYKL